MADLMFKQKKNTKQRIQTQAVLDLVGDDNDIDRNDNDDDDNDSSDANDPGDGSIVDLCLNNNEKDQDNLSKQQQQQNRGSKRRSSLLTARLQTLHELHDSDDSDDDDNNNNNTTTTTTTTTIVHNHKRRKTRQTRLEAVPISLLENQRPSRTSNRQSRLDTYLPDAVKQHTSLRKASHDLVSHHNIIIII
jgi:hypothetical protein